MGSLATPSFQYIELLISYYLLHWYRKNGKHDSNSAKTLFAKYVTFKRSNISSKDRTGRGVFYDPFRFPGLGDISEAQDRSIIEYYLMSHFIKPKNVGMQPFDRLLDKNFLERVVAEAKLLGGADEVKWCSFLPPSNVQELKEKVQIDFVEYNQNSFTVDETVTLHTNIKNVSQVISKVRGYSTR